MTAMKVTTNMMRGMECPQRGYVRVYMGIVSCPGHKAPTARVTILRPQSFEV